MTEAEALAEVIKHAETLQVDLLDTAMLLKSAASYFETKANTHVMRDIMHKAILQATMPSDISKVN